MLIKSFCLGAVLVSTPLCLMTPQGKERDRSAPAVQDPRPSETLSPRQRAELKKVRRELDGAKRDLVEMRGQLEEVLDALDATFASRQHRNCSPSRNRGLMSHYQWLDQNNHPARADKALATIVKQAGNRVSSLNSAAWSLMTDDDTAGKFDRVALALAERMEASKGELRHHYLDTIALARFLNGQGERAVALQKKAIAAGGTSDDYRRRLRTYEVARDALVVARQMPKSTMPGRLMPVRATNGTIVATNQEEDE